MYLLSCTTTACPGKVKTLPRLISAYSFILRSSTGLRVTSRVKETRATTGILLVFDWLPTIGSCSVSIRAFVAHTRNA